MSKPLAAMSHAATLPGGMAAPATAQAYGRHHHCRRPASRPTSDR